MGRLFRNYECLITQEFKSGTHGGIDLVGKGENGAMCVDFILAHSDGIVVAIEKDYNKTDKTGSSYGNYIKLRHPNGMFTLYAHMKYGSVRFNVGDTVVKGSTLGYMGNTGHSLGAHLHFEVRDKNDKKIDPKPYLNADLSNQVDTDNKIKYTVVKGDTLNKIAKKYGVTVNAIAILNGITNVNLIYPKQELYIPVSGNVSEQALKVGDLVKLKDGCTYWNGKAIPNWVRKSKLYYRGENKNGQIFSILKIGAITGTVAKGNLIKA